MNSNDFQQQKPFHLQISLPLVLLFLVELVVGVYLYERRDHWREDIEKVLMAAIKVAYGESSSSTSIAVFAVDRMQRSVRDILPQSSGDYDPEVHLELKKPPSPSEISIRRNFCISIRTKTILRNYIKMFLETIRRLQFLFRNDISLIRRNSFDLPYD